MPNFYPIPDFRAEERISARTRRLVGDGTPYLRAPGLQKFESVRLEMMEISSPIRQQFPADAQQSRFIEEVSDLVRLAWTADGEPVLLRSRQSNDGFWQKDVPVFITGEWQEAPDPAEHDGADPPLTAHSSLPTAPGRRPRR